MRENSALGGSYLWQRMIRLWVDGSVTEREGVIALHFRVRHVVAPWEGVICGEVRR